MPTSAPRILFTGLSTILVNGGGGGGTLEIERLVSCEAMYDDWRCLDGGGGACGFGIADVEEEVIAGIEKRDDGVAAGGLAVPALLPNILSRDMAERYFGERDVCRPGRRSQLRNCRRSRYE